MARALRISGFVLCLALGCGRASDASETREAESASSAPAAPAEEARHRPDPPPAPAPDPAAALPCPTSGDRPEGMACVEGGTFTLGNPSGMPDEREPGEVYVDTFFMDLREVTNQAYESCIEAGRCRRPREFSGFGGPRQPVVNASWFDAVAFCEMVGKRLPTEAEWERAAKGPDETRYPWGDEELGCERASIKDERRGEGCGRRRTSPVGSLPPGHFGLYDMAGNVHEWVYDWYSPCLRGCENECGDACFGRNPRGPCNGETPCPDHELRSIRGGSWYWPVERARAAARRGSDPVNRWPPHRFGFRCAADLRVEDDGNR